MSTFTSPLIVSPMPDGRKWKLYKSFKYHVGSKYSRNVITVPKGFVTDFASVPWGLWNLFPTWGKYGKASVLHDYCYQSKCVSRAKSDLIFKEAMGVLRVPRWRIFSMYWFVRIFGWLAWKGKSNSSSDRPSV